LITSPRAGFLFPDEIVEQRQIVPALKSLDEEAFSAKVTSEEDVAFEGAVAFCIDEGNISLPKLSMVALLVRLIAYFPFGGAVNDQPISKTSATAYSPGRQTKEAISTISISDGFGNDVPPLVALD
jgi:hypothetical protein